MKSEEIENLILKHKLKPSGESKLMTEDEYLKMEKHNTEQKTQPRSPIPELIDARDEIERLKKTIRDQERMLRSQQLAIDQLQGFTE